MISIRFNSRVSHLGSELCWICQIPIPNHLTYNASVPDYSRAGTMEPLAGDGYARFTWNFLYDYVYGHSDKYIAPSSGVVLGFLRAGRWIGNRRMLCVF